MFQFYFYLFLFHVSIMNILVCIFCIVCDLGALIIAQKIKVIGFFANRWLVHNWFMGLSNLLEVVVHHLLIGDMVNLSYRDGFLMVSALVCMATHWTGPTVSHDWRLSSSHDLTMLLHCVISQPWDNIELVLKLAVALTYGWPYIPYGLGHCWW